MQSVFLIPSAEQRPVEEEQGQSFKHVNPNMEIAYLRIVVQRLLLQYGKRNYFVPLQTFSMIILCIY